MGIKPHGRDRPEKSSTCNQRNITSELPYNMYHNNMIDRTFEEDVYDFAHYQRRVKIPIWCIHPKPKISTRNSPWSSRDP